jgi:membrane fusion protein, copper/silver efflux system
MSETVPSGSRRVAHRLWHHTRGALIALAVLIAFVFGYAMNSSGDPVGPGTPVMQNSPATGVEYTCAMHPQVRMPNPDDRCPICGMELIPVAGEEPLDTVPRRMSFTPEAAALMNVQVSPVIRAAAEVDVSMVGKVEYDETRLSYITARVPGRIDRLFVDYTGTPIRKGDHLAEFYSPDLLVGQEELIQALDALDRLGEDAPDSIRRIQQALLAAAREKLRLWGLLPEQITSIELSRTATDHITLFSPLPGIVAEKHAKLGQYLDTGERIYTLADLSSVWIILDAYESDLIWLRYGQEVRFTTEAYPGETFTGMIAFIDPVLDEVRRVVRVRVNAKNTDGKLKPGMFVKAGATATVSGSTGGKVMAPGLEGKWVGPMHPEIIKDGPGDCDICGMPLVPASELGYVTTADSEKPLLIPATAVLRTGKRAVVYLQTGTSDQPSFEGREIELGPRAGDMFIVEAGLNEGDLVVTQGNFKIDSALQIAARPSMMNPKGGQTTTGHEYHGGQEPAQTQPASNPDTADPSASAPLAGPLENLILAYYDVASALANDDVEQAREALTHTHHALASVDTDSLAGPAGEAWSVMNREILDAIELASSGESVEDIRSAFSILSESIAKAARTFGQGMTGPVYLVHCPMAFEFKGANWLQPDETIANPYFGASMLRCGTVRETLVESASEAQSHKHE